MEDLLKVGFLSIFVILGAAMVTYCFFLRSQAKQAKRWPTTTATIQELTYVEDDGEGGQEAKIVYHYLVKRQTYQGSAIAFGYSASSSPAYHRRIYESLNKKTSINIYYNPRHPQQAVISTALGKGASIGIAVGLFFTVLGLSFIVNILVTSTAIFLITLVIDIVVFLGVAFFAISHLNLRRNDPLIQDLIRR